MKAGYTQYGNCDSIIHRGLVYLCKRGLPSKEYVRNEHRYKHASMVHKDHLYLF